MIAELVGAGYTELAEKVRVHAFKEDMAPQVILLMGLPAAGKSTFVKKHLAKFYNHRIPHLGAFQVLNSDGQLRRMQYERAKNDYAALQGVSEQDWANKTKEMEYTSNDGKIVNFPLTYPDFTQLKDFKAYMAATFKPYYATYFGDRAKAKQYNDELTDKKIEAGDVVILDSTGADSTKMLKYFKQAKARGYTTSVVWLEIDPKHSIARDQYRGETEGRSVGERVILSYVPKLKKAHGVYKTSDLVDRILHFRWNGGVIKGDYQLVKEIKNYPKMR
jgi:predicted kinase